MDIKLPSLPSGEGAGGGVRRQSLSHKTLLYIIVNTTHFHLSILMEREGGRRPGVEASRAGPKAGS